MKNCKSLFYFENAHNIKYPNDIIKILYRLNDYLYFSTKFGLCKKLISSFCSSNYNIQSAINKTEFTINKLLFIYKDMYEYNLVQFNKSTRDKIILICKIHGKFNVNLHQAFTGKAVCPVCSKINTKIKTSYTTEEFVEKANKVHNFKYDYSETIYEISTEKVQIKCLKHGIFLQKAQRHLLGHGCKKCSNELNKIINCKNPTGWRKTDWINSAKKSKHFDSFKVYIIKCQNNDEEFYKIGRTYRKINKRFIGGKIMPYKYKIEKIYEGNAEEIYNLEINLKNLNKEYKYIPKIKFGGMYECFKKIKYLND